MRPENGLRDPTKRRRDSKNKTPQRNNLEHKQMRHRCTAYVIGSLCVVCVRVCVVVLTRACTWGEWKVSALVLRGL
jgi:hypothetical protein